MRIAIWQGQSPASDLTAAITQAEAALRAAGALGASALVLPEIWLQGYNQPDLRARALAQDDAVFDRLAAVAQQAGCGLVIGYAETAGGALFNAAAYLAADGQTRAHYRKLQLYGLREHALYQPGAQYVTFALGHLTAAMLICYDVEFAPHIARLAAMGVDLLLVPTANMQPFTHVADHTVPAMAANHGLAIAYANYCGAEGDLTYVGGSLIAGPHGEVLAKAGHFPALLLAEIPLPDPARISTQAKDLREI